MTRRQVIPGTVIRGPTLPEPVEVLAVQQFGESLKLIGRGLNAGMTHDPVLSPTQLDQLEISTNQEPFDGDARLFRLGVEAQRLGLAYEYDPFFALSIARVDPLPHQLEAVYGYFMRLPRIRFLLADDPGAGKTIMAGLLLKELRDCPEREGEAPAEPSNCNGARQFWLSRSFALPELPLSGQPLKGGTMSATFGRHGTSPVTFCHAWVFLTAQSKTRCTATGQHDMSRHVIAEGHGI